MSNVCIGVPVYNGEKFIERALESILRQTYADFRVIIVDNASTDNTPQICREFLSRDPRITLVQNPENIGAPRNFNRAVELSDSKYFKWAAHDDGIDPEYLRKCVAVLDDDPDVVLCHSRVRVVDEGGELIRDYHSPLTRIDSMDPVKRFADFALAPHACYEVFGVIRRSALVKTGQIGSFLSSDRVFLSELALSGRVVTIPEVLFSSGEHHERSVRMPVRRRVREWWATGDNSGRKIVFPHWRLLTEYLAAIRRASPRASVSVACYGIMCRWAIKNWRLLASDLRAVVHSM